MPGWAYPTLHHQSGSCDGRHQGPRNNGQADLKPLSSAASAPRQVSSGFPAARQLKVRRIACFSISGHLSSGRRKPRLTGNSYRSCSGSMAAGTTWKAAATRTSTDQLAGQNHVVVVTINHRLGPPGMVQASCLAIRRFITGRQFRQLWHT